MMWRLTIILLVGVFIVACNTDERAIERAIEPMHSGFVIPKNAIQVGKDLYYLPVGTDSDGCTMYQAYAPNAMTAQGIIYQNGRGNFSLSKNKDTCL